MYVYSLELIISVSLVKTIIGISEVYFLKESTTTSSCLPHCSLLVWVAVLSISIQSLWFPASASDRGVWPHLEIFHRKYPLTIFGPSDH